MQFLESYKSVTIDSMASAFGVSVAFLDEEIADFIVAGRLSAKIDRISGIIETNRLVLFQICFHSKGYSVCLRLHSSAPS